MFEFEVPVSCSNNGLHNVCTMQVLLERLRNEITRLTAVKAFASIAQSSLDLDLSPVLEPLLAELTTFLRKANRVLRQASLAAIEVACDINLMHLH